MLQPSAPHTYPRRILLAVTGLSPQVVTETLYALVRQTPFPFVPTEIHLITTADGAERARLALLSDEPGWFHRLRQDFSLPGIAFDEQSIHIIRTPDGRPLSDIRSPADNLLCADRITDLVREFSSDPTSALHVSISGGRKTMGFFLGYALSLFGRAQDRLSHVLVSEPFENSWNFFYPTPYENVIQTSDNKLADARNAEIGLAEIPFVALREGLPDALLDGTASFEATICAARAAINSPRLEIDLVTREIRAAGKRFKLPPAELALLTIFARHALAHGDPITAPHKDIPDPAWASRYLRELRSIVGPLADISSTEHALRHGMDGGYFSSRLSKLHRTLRQHLGVAAAHYRINDGGRRPHRYCIALAPDAIHLRAID